MTNNCTHRKGKNKYYCISQFPIPVRIDVPLTLNKAEQFSPAVWKNERKKTDLDKATRQS